MVVTINDEQQEVGDNLSIAELVAHLQLPDNRLAIELNRAVVRRVDWAQTKLQAGDRLEIVHFVGGGCGDCQR